MTRKELELKIHLINLLNARKRDWEEQLNNLQNDQ
jgi:hypothetical protein